MENSISSLVASIENPFSIDDSFELEILDPQKVRIFRYGGRTRMTIGEEKSIIRVMVLRAFPLSDPNHYYAFLDSASHDVGVIVNPHEIDPESRRVCEEDLERRYFIPTVQRVKSAIEEWGSVTWVVETDRGEREYTVRGMRDNMVELSANRVMLTDIDGNRFEIRDLSKLDVVSQNLVLRYL